MSTPSQAVAALLLILFCSLTGLAWERNANVMRLGGQTISPQHEWETYQTEIENQLINVRSLKQRAHEERDPYKALELVLEAEQTVLDFPTLAADFTTHHSLAKTLRELSKHHDDIDTILFELLWVRADANRRIGTRDALRAACVDLTWLLNDPRQRTPWAVRRDLARVLVELGLVEGTLGPLARALLTDQPHADAVDLFELPREAPPRLPEPWLWWP